MDTFTNEELSGIYEGARTKYVDEQRKKAKEFSDLAKHSDIFDGTKFKRKALEAREEADKYSGKSWCGTILNPHDAYRPGTAVSDYYSSLRAKEKFKQDTSGSHPKNKALHDKINKRSSKGCSCRESFVTEEAYANFFCEGKFDREKDYQRKIHSPKNIGKIILNPKAQDRVKKAPVFSMEELEKKCKNSKIVNPDDNKDFSKKI